MEEILVEPDRDDALREELLREVEAQRAEVHVAPNLGRGLNIGSVGALATALAVGISPKP